MSGGDVRVINPEDGPSAEVATYFFGRDLQKVVISVSLSSKSTLSFTKATATIFWYFPRDPPDRVVFRWTSSSSTTALKRKGLSGSLLNPSSKCDLRCGFVTHLDSGVGFEGGTDVFYDL